ncbi:adenylate/guanylate cyclase domain-containing protein [Leptospira yanagawae]|uniref:Adenylate/guanylate cyclase domain-containing protein n=1 Tax=Leptospira yanagawae TaxID=293069 RepID=A0ABY2LXL1_9LEPT|nr:adenylate/guanylate cyclase domain-containing protein [Leptospira yanagawae]TGL17463.1 adenylate/guanylate cyclase domain-containing protein [Leptospira yanagawae]
MESSRVLLFEILKSERKRAKALFWLFLSGAVALLFQVLFIRDDLLSKNVQPFPIWVPPAYFLFNTLYAYILLKILDSNLRDGRFPPVMIRYLGALVESSIPSGLLLYLGINLEVPILALNSPPELAYFFFIILATLRLDIGLAIFIGFVSWAEYLGIVYYFLQNTKPGAVDPLLYSFPIYFGKANIFLVGGFLSAFVSRQIRTSFINSLAAESEKNQIRVLFGQHVSPEVVNTLLHQRDDWNGEEKHVCILFFDIRDFTKFAETQKPTDLIQFLNRLFQDVIICINQNGGIVNKFLGDGFMAVFGAPISNGTDIQSCAKAAKEIRKCIQSLVERKEIPAIKIGMGIHSGEVVTGTVGSRDRKEYTVIGDVVNLASRLEQLTKEYGRDVILSDSVASALEPTTVELLGETHVKGKEKPVKVYALL